MATTVVKLTWTEQMDLQDELDRLREEALLSDDEDVQITLDSRDGKIVHSVFFADYTVSPSFDKAARFRRQARRETPAMYRDVPTEPKAEKERPNKPLCRKGEACVNKKCTFVHPARQRR